MNFKKILKSMLLERDDVKRSKGCVMAELKIGGGDWKEIQSHIEDDEIYNKDDKFGREDAPHVTVLYGILPDVSDEDVEAVIDTFESFEVELNEVGMFENDGEFDVVKFNVSNKTLTKYNKLLKELPYENDYPTYEAHATIAYVDKGKGKDIIERFKDVKPMSFKVNTIKYSKADKSKEFYTLKSNE